MTNRPRRSRPTKTRGQTIDLKAEKKTTVSEGDKTTATAAAKSDARPDVSAEAAPDRAPPCAGKSPEDAVCCDVIAILSNLVTPRHPEVTKRVEHD